MASLEADGDMEVECGLTSVRRIPVVNLCRGRGRPGSRQRERSASPTGPRTATTHPTEHSGARVIPSSVELGGSLYSLMDLSLDRGRFVVVV